MAESRKLTTIVSADVVGYSRLAAIDEERTVARLRALRGDLIDPAITAHHGRIVKRTGDGTLMEFRSVVDAVRCSIEVQNGMIERNAGLPPERQILFRVGIHLGDVIEEADGDLMGDGVNIAARLESICAPGAICLSEDAYRQVRSRLDLAVSDLGDKELKNIPEKVHVFSLEVGKPAVAQPAQKDSVVPAQAGTQSQRTSLALDSRLRGNDEKGKAPKLLSIIAGVAVLVIAAIAAWYFLAGPGGKVRVANAPAHLSIVVLPFANLSNDPKQDYFADGITDNLTTDLSRIRNSFVIARDTSFTYKGKAQDAKEIGKQLDVRYILEGSVQRDGSRVRVNAQLIDAQSGAGLWADRFEEDLSDLFKLQDDVVARLANTLGYELVKAEAEKSAHATNPDAIDLTMQGWALLNTAGRNKARYEQARKLFESALKLDPQVPEAMVGIALIDSRGVVYGWISKPDPALTIPLGLVDKALAINPNYALAYYVRSYALFFARRYTDSVLAAQTGVSIDPNSAYSYFALAQAEKQLGQCEQAISHMKEAFRLSPRDPAGGVWHMELGIAENCVGRRDIALNELRRAIDAGFRTYVAYINLAGIAALNGDQNEAKSALADAQRLAPDLSSVKWVAAHIPTTPQVLDGLRKAGLPEQ